MREHALAEPLRATVRAMERLAVFLRGMNLGRRRISNADLRACVAGLGGFADVAVVRASGNVIVTLEEAESAPALADRLERGLEETLGYPVAVFVRDARQVEAIAAATPFPAAAVAASAGKLQVALLAARPAPTTREASLAHATEQDRLAIEGTELYWLPSGGVSESALDTRAAFGPLGPATMRTQATIALIAAKHFAS